MYWYLSFATDEDGFRGGNIVQADDFLGAVSESSRLGINPHGQCIGLPLSEANIPAEEWHNHLLNKEDVCRIWADATRIGDLDSENSN